MTQIINLKAREILDSRGNPTLEVDVHTPTIHQTAAVPSGASTGKYEAVELRDGGKAYHGMGVQKAIRNVGRVLFPLLRGLDVTQQRHIDQLMIEKDGTNDKRRLGANALLGVSLACARAGAEANNQFLFENLNVQLQFNVQPKLPRLFFNILNGGKHAGNGMAFQEFMIASRVKTIAEQLRIASEVYHALKGIIAAEYGAEAFGVGDEGGFAPPISRPEHALELLKAALRKSGHSRVDIALDCAASEFYRRGAYFIPGKMRREKLLNYYLSLVRKYGIISIEDPFEQDDFAGFAELQERGSGIKSGFLVVGDDLTVSSVRRISEAISKKSCRCVLLKPNQVGTLSETLDAVKLAYENGLKVMASHRSGETEDSFIADLAVGIGCGMLKAGAPCRGERTAKYNRLLRIEEIINKLQ